MANLTFADMHNMVAYLSKYDASTSFDQLVDFLNGHIIHYALMVNPTIYVSCIKQFWATASIKKAKDMVKLRALIDGKRVVVTEDDIRQDICWMMLMWKFLIYLLVQCISAKRTAWNEFNYSMASAVICLAQVENPTSLMDDLSSHNNQYTSPALTQKVFANMRRVGKGFSGVETPLFASMLGGKIAEIDANKDITLVDAKTQVDMDAKLYGRKDDVSAVATKDVSVAEPTVFDDEEVTMTMAQTLIKMKAEKARLFDEQIAKRLHDEEVKQAAAKEKQENDDLEKAKVLQKQYEDKQENIDCNTIAERIQEKHLDNIRKYQSLKRKLISIAQANKNMIIYLKNIAGYKMEHFRETLLQESFKKLEAVEVSGSRSTQDTLTNDPKEISEEDVKNMLEIVPVYEFKKNHPLSNAVMILMLSAKLQVEEDSEMARDLVMKIFMEANKPKSRSLDTSSK
nr:hypothetical protein [Tanacetum cinerariifolium]